MSTDLEFSSSIFISNSRFYLRISFNKNETDPRKKALGWKKLTPKRKSKAMLALNLATSKRQPMSFLLGDHWSMINWNGAGLVAYRKILNMWHLSAIFEAVNISTKKYCFAIAACFTPPSYHKDKIRCNISKQVINNWSFVVVINKLFRMNNI